jgi:hypothetical protein
VLKRDDKPPWLARNPRERKWMETWINEQLDAIIAVNEKEFNAGITSLLRLPSETQRAIIKQQVAAARAHLDANGGRARRDLAIEAAEEGDIEPLRKTDKDRPALWSFCQPT